MNKLMFVSVMTALVSQAAGCIIQSDPGNGGGGGGGGGSGGGGNDVATISARWALRNMADGATTACPTGFDTVQVIAQPIDANGNAVADPTTDLFDCKAG